MHGPDKSKVNNDGGQVGYLYPSENNIERYGCCDRELWDKLGHLVGYGARCVHCIEAGGVLPGDADYYNAPLFYVPRLRRGLKAATREHWFRYALLKVQYADIVLVDPGQRTGFARKNVSEGRAKIRVSVRPICVVGAEQESGALSARRPRQKRP